MECAVTARAGTRPAISSAIAAPVIAATTS